MNGRTFLMIVAALAAAPAAAAPVCRAASDALTHPLVELYTSEGCDSCPPADRWLAAQFDPARHRSAIALAFHVDYWDRLGWVDRFAKHAYTERQYEAMRANGATFVYTPQVLLQGRDFSWQGAGDAIDAQTQKAARATIAIETHNGERDVVVRADARIADRSVARDAQLFVAYADNGLVSDVKAGENRGVRLTHEHVVRDFGTAGSFDAEGRAQAAVTLHKPREAGKRPQIVAFVQRTSTGDVLQALALPLDGCAVP